MTNEEAIEAMELDVKISSLMEAELSYADKVLLAAHKIALDNMKKSEKYRWHDLRNNPDDLPPENGWYSCWLRNDTINYGMDLYFYTKSNQFIDNRRRDVFQVYDVMAIDIDNPLNKKRIYSDDCVNRTDSVIAWAYKEPFDEEE